MIYDCFTFFDELDLLEIRLNILSPVVDKFVIVEADRTHSNKSKTFIFDENKSRYAPFLNKIIYIKVTEYPVFETSWTFENFQRNMIMEGLKDCNPDDVILISDLDEIPNPMAIKKYNNEGIFKLRQSFSYYFINYQNVVNKYWYGARIMRYNIFLTDIIEQYEYSYNDTLIESSNRSCTPTKIRIIKNLPVIKDGGWHFSYLGGIEKIKYKIKSFSHQEFNTEIFLNDDTIELKLRKGLDLYDRKENRYIPVSINNKRFPEYIVKNKEKYSELIVKDISIIRNIFVSVKAYSYYLFVYLVFKMVRNILKLLK